MAYIKKIFHLYETYKSFDEHLKEGFINPDSIVFIKETLQIYTQGTVFGLSKIDFDNSLEAIQNLQRSIEAITTLSPDGNALTSLSDVIRYLNGFTTSDNLKKILDGIDVGFSKEILQEAIDNASEALSLSLSTKANVDNKLSEYSTLINNLSSSVVEVSYLLNNLRNSIGAAGGIAPLDNTGKVPASNLPSYVDDVLEYASVTEFPSTGETGKIYVSLDDNLTYRWSGSTYIEISKSLSLGETASTAYSGNKGKQNADNIASHKADHNNPHKVTKAQIGLGNVDNTSDIDKPLSTAVQMALSTKVNSVPGKALSTNDFTDEYKNIIDNPWDETIE